MTSIQADNYSIHFNAEAYKHLNSYLNTVKFSKIFVIVDSNTHDYCLPKFLANVETEVTIEIIEIEAGEIHKNIETCVGVWEALAELDADRKALIINLGGGVVTDLGGFVACTYKRGISYLNVPTSLLAMVDASVGGKTGVDLGVLKNQVGVINSGEMVLIDTSFLQTLPDIQMLSGLAEMLKHGLIYSRNYWNKFNDWTLKNFDELDALIYESVQIKYDIVTEDPFENDRRKSLNFGHTLGHAVESFYLTNPSKRELLHGEAIAAGIILECFISYKLAEFSKKDLDEVVSIITRLYQKVEINSNEYNPIIELLKHDKKNSYGNINFVLLENIGSPKLDCKVENNLIVEAFDFYNNCYK
ncbi:3-dehydroquinate synthase [Paucihalobacter sp.]|uniref:3-dehydroquinate synthase n=1 Tax=Paucihalobacter sp. TaxID=2850405 RepID=UPI002FE2D129